MKNLKTFGYKTIISFTDKNVKKETFVINELHKDTEIEDLMSELQTFN